MAKVVLLECDRCGASKDVSSLQGSRSDGKHIDVDLCPKCWTALVKEFHARVSDKQPRRPFEVVDEDDIR